MKSGWNNEFGKWLFTFQKFSFDKEFVNEANNENMQRLHSCGECSNDLEVGNGRENSFMKYPDWPI